MSGRKKRDGTRPRRTGIARAPVTAALALAAAVAVVTAAVVTVVMAPKAATSVAHARTDDGSRLRVMQYNICGAAAGCPGNAGRSGAGTSVARAVSEAVHYRPDILTVNEICRSQYRELKKSLARAGWAMDGTYASAQDNVPNCGRDRRFGSAVLSRAPVPDDVHEYHAFTDTGGETYTNGGRTVTVRRGLLCAETSFRGRPLKACTAHAYAKASGQIREIRDWTADPAFFPAGVPVVIAGDLNLQPNSPALAQLYGTARSRPESTDPGPAGADGTTGSAGPFLEGDERDIRWFRATSTGGVVCRAAETAWCRNGAPTAAGRKIDYVFADSRDFDAPTEETRTFPESDHAVVEAAFTLRRSPAAR